MNSDVRLVLIRIGVVLGKDGGALGFYFLNILLYKQIVFLKRNIILHFFSYFKKEYHTTCTFLLLVSISASWRSPDLTEIGSKEMRF